MKKNETVREILEWLGAKLLMTEPNADIEISHAMAADIVAILSSLPAGKAGRPKQWTAETENPRGLQLARPHAGQRSGARDRQGDRAA